MPGPQKQNSRPTSAPRRTAGQDQGRPWWREWEALLGPAAAIAARVAAPPIVQPLIGPYIRPPGRRPPYVRPPVQPPARQTARAGPSTRPPAAAPAPQAPLKAYEIGRDAVVPGVFGHKAIVTDARYPGDPTAHVHGWGPGEHWYDMLSLVPRDYEDDGVAWRDSRKNPKVDIRELDASNEATRRAVARVQGHPFYSPLPQVTDRLANTLILGPLPAALADTIATVSGRRPLSMLPGANSNSAETAAALLAEGHPARQSFRGKRFYPGSSVADRVTIRP